MSLPSRATGPGAPGFLGFFGGALDVVKNVAGMIPLPQAQLLAGGIGAAQGLLGGGAGALAAGPGGMIPGRFYPSGKRGTVLVANKKGQVRSVRTGTSAVIGKNLPRHRQLVKLRHNLARHRADARMVLQLVSPGSLARKGQGGRGGYRGGWKKGRRK